MAETIFKPQSGTTLPEAIKEAITKAKALEKATGYGYIELHFQDLIIGINELSDLKCTLEEVFQELKYKYERQGGTTHPTLESNNYWLTKVKRT